MKLILSLLLPALLAQSVLGGDDHVVGAAEGAERHLDAAFKIYQPTDAPVAPTDEPTMEPTPEPTKVPTMAPTKRPTKPPTKAPTIVAYDGPEVPANFIPPLCGSQVTSDGVAIANETAYDDYDYDFLGKKGNVFHRGFLSGRVGMFVSRGCRYYMRDQEYNYYDVAGLNEWFEAGAKLFGGKELYDPDAERSRFTGFGYPWEDDIVRVYEPCAEGKFCTAMLYNEANPILTATKVFEFPSSWRQGEFHRFMKSTLAKNKWMDPFRVYGTNSYLKCGVPPFCHRPGRGYLGGGTCYVDPIGWSNPSGQCEKYKFMIDYAEGMAPEDSVSGGLDVWPWFNECCASFKCKRARSKGKLGYGRPAMWKGQYGNGTHYFRIKGGGSGDFRWNCESQFDAEMMYDFAMKVRASGLTLSKPKPGCTPKPDIPDIIDEEPTPAPTYEETVECTPEMTEVDNPPTTVSGYKVNVKRPFGYCFGKNAKAWIAEGTCNDVTFMLSGDTTGYKPGDDVMAWFDASIETMFGCKLENPDDLKRITYKGYPKWGVESRIVDGERKYWFRLRKWRGRISGKSKNIRWECPSGAAAYDAQSHFWTTVTRNAQSGNWFGDLWRIKPKEECTDEPTAAPVETSSPTITASPTATPSMFPTYCQESYLDSDKLNIALVVDLSYSTYKYNFSGTPVGDFNGDGKADTILDAEVVAVNELLNAISESETLTNDNTEIGLISFHTDAKFEGVYKPLSDDNEGINDDLMSYIKTNLRTETSEQAIMTTNNGFTNFDAALDRAVDYFKDTATPGRLNLLVFLSDGVPNVRGDGDSETYCADTVQFWKEQPLQDYSCSDLELEPGQKLDFPLADTDFTLTNAYQDCIRGPTFCDNADAATQYASELAALDEMKVARLAIGVGEMSNVEQGSALWMIDDNPGKMAGILPTQALSTGELSRAVSNLCILNTKNPTSAPSASPSSAPTKSPAPSSSPTVMNPNDCPADVMEVKTVGLDKLPVNHIKIVSQDSTTVTVELSQTWSDSISWIYYDYALDAFNQKCFAENDVTKGKYETITISCTSHSKMATLRLYAADAIFTGSDGTVPDCCYPEGGIPPVTEHVLEIACETRCVEEES